MKTGKKIIKRLFNNWALKLFSLIAAVLLWLLVMNIEDPEDQRSYYNIPVRLTNTEVLTDAGMVYEVLDRTDTVRTVTIIAPKTVRDELSASDIIAEADFSKLTVTNTVEIEFYSLRYNDKIISITGSNEILKLNIEAKKMKRLAVEVQTTGEVAEGYIVSSVTPDQNRIEVTGPESAVSRIASAVVKVDVTDSTSDISTNADVILYDADGKEISMDNLSVNVNSVLVRVKILATKTVPVRYSVTGVPAAGYLFTGEVSGMPEQVTIAGTSSVLEGVRSIVIPEEHLDISNRTENLTVNINIADYLPEDTVLEDDSFNGRAAVTVHIEKEYTRNMNIAADHIRITGVPDGYTVVLEESDSSRVLSVRGLRSAVEGISEASLYGTIHIPDFMEAHNMEHLAEGTYEAVAEFSIEDEITIVQPFRVRIIITSLEESE